MILTGWKVVRGKAPKKGKVMKPSQRIYRLIGSASSDSEWRDKAIDAIIEYLDEVHEAQQALGGRNVAE